MSDQTEPEQAMDGEPPQAQSNSSGAHDQSENAPQEAPSHESSEGADAGNDDAEADPVEDQKVPETITFRHPFFSKIEGSKFRILEDTGEPVMMMKLDDQGMVSLPLRGIHRELKLDPDDPDAKMLSVVEQCLQYIQEIRVGDPVPSELTSGRASWEIMDEHRAIAHNRVTMQLVSWMSGDEMLITDPTELAQVVEDPATKEKISTAFAKAAKALHLDESNHEAVLMLIANLAEELAFIEALRFEFHEITRIYRTLVELEKKYISEQSVRDTIISVRRLYLIAMRGFQDDFENLDAQTGEILSALQNIAQVTKYIRKNRDDLHRRLWAWEGIISTWKDIPAQRSTKAEKHLDILYRFLAQRYLPRDEWELYADAVDKTKKKNTAVVW